MIIGSGIGGIITLSQQFEVLSERGTKAGEPLSNPHDAGRYGLRPRFDGNGVHGGQLLHGFVMLQRGRRPGAGLGNDQAGTGRGGAGRAAVKPPSIPVAVAGFNSRCGPFPAINEHPQEEPAVPSTWSETGFVIGEGAAVLVLESEASATRRGEARPFWPSFEVTRATSDAHHLTEPAPGGGERRHCDEDGPEGRRISSPSAVDYINAHGTSTPLNDRQETKRNQTGVGGRRLPRFPSAPASL